MEPSRVILETCALTPGEHSNSDTKRRPGLTKAGSAAVRWLLVQAAWTALRTRPNDPMVLWARRMTERKQNRFVAVAVARKIAGVMFALLRDKAKYQAHRASTVRADETATVVAAGAEVTALARASSSDTARAKAGPDIRPRRLAKTRATAPTPKASSAGWGMVGDEARRCSSRARCRHVDDAQPPPASDAGGTHSAQHAGRRAVPLLRAQEPET